MSINQRCSILGLAFAVLFTISACQNQPSVSTAQMNATETILITISRPTDTPKPTELLTSTAGITPTVPFPVSWTPRASMTPSPTLDPLQGYQDLMKRLETNGGCTLPCLIGIAPGKTTWNEASALFLSLGKRIPGPFPYPKYNLQAYHYQFLGKDYPQGYDFYFYVEDNNIQLIHSFMIFDVNKNPEMAKTYSIREIVKTLGKPSAIYYAPSMLDESGINIYRLYIVFNSADYFVITDYLGVAIHGEKDLRFCPTDLSQGYTGDRYANEIDIIAQAGLQKYTFAELYDFIGWMAKPNGHDFEEMTGESLDTFYARITQGTSKVCFTAPMSFVYR